MSDRLRREVGRGGLFVADRAVTVSSEKYLRTGVLHSIALNAAVMALYRTGLATPDRLADELYGRGWQPPAGWRFWPALARQIRRAVQS